MIRIVREIKSYIVYNGERAINVRADKRRDILEEFNLSDGSSKKYVSRCEFEFRDEEIEVDLTR